MIKSEKFSIGFLRSSARDESLFLSVTPGFEHGPGIQRDGITQPRMSDPHSVDWVCQSRNLAADHTLPATTDPYLQRAGTWTLYNHVKEFVAAKGKDWTVVGVQSCGDLTMNPWHVAYLGASHLSNQSGKLCGLLTQGDPIEPTGSRVYRSLVKWKQDSGAPRPFDWLDVRFSSVQNGYAAFAKSDEGFSDAWMPDLGYPRDPQALDIAPYVEFILSGKPIIEKSSELSLANVIDRFQDIRHVYNLPTVLAKGSFKGETVEEINFGEYQLFHQLNERRAALSSAVIIDLNIGDYVTVDWDNLRKKLLARHFRETTESPTRRGFFRRYVDDISRDKAEIFFPHNVYPFGVLGSHGDTMVCLASGGLSGRVGNTLEGITRIMYDFFGCSDAMVLDEGYDTFQIVNPPDNEWYRYDNEMLLRKIRSFSGRLVEKDHSESLQAGVRHPGGLKNWPLNQTLLRDFEVKTSREIADSADILAVAPHRSQMRSVLILAARRTASSGARSAKPPVRAKQSGSGGLARNDGRPSKETPLSAESFALTKGASASPPAAPEIASGERRSKRLR